MPERKQKKNKRKDGERVYRLTSSAEVNVPAVLGAFLETVTGRRKLLVVLRECWPELPEDVILKLAAREYTVKGTTVIVTVP